ncbi:MAG: hypothetical protein CMK07_04500 [Ponticaulis sp.]|nr:hypothetical protein [Ponticaulis sp.]
MFSRSFNKAIFVATLMLITASCSEKSQSTSASPKDESSADTFTMLNMWYGEAVVFDFVRGLVAFGDVGEKAEFCRTPNEICMVSRVPIASSKNVEELAEVMKGRGWQVEKLEFHPQSTFYRYIFTSADSLERWKLAFTRNSSMPIAIFQETRRTEDDTWDVLAPYVSE